MLESYVDNESLREIYHSSSDALWSLLEEQPFPSQQILPDSLLALTYTGSTPQIYACFQLFLVGSASLNGLQSAPTQLPHSFLRGREEKASTSRPGRNLYR
jgi:hypothetical protein